MTATASPHATSDAAEVGKFDALAHRFWDAKGEFKPLLQKISAEAANAGSM